MALLMSSKQDVFFSKLFGPGSPEALTAQKYQAAGYDFETSLYSITASKAGVPVDALTLTASTISLLNGTLGVAVVLQNKSKIADWLKSLPTFHATPKPQVFKVILTGLVPGANKLVAIKAVMSTLEPGIASPLGYAKSLVETLEQGMTTVLGTYPSLGAVEAIVTGLQAKGVQAVVKKEEATLVFGDTPAVTVEVPKPVSQVIDLKDAKAIGQKVHGTSPGSVYHVIALTEKVKVAARLNATGAISLRAEWTGEAADAQKKLAHIGMSMKSGYASWHLDAAGVPFARVIGAFLLDTGIVWDQSIKSSADLVIS